jgi:hypothetical protein
MLAVAALQDSDAYSKCQWGLHIATMNCCESCASATTCNHKDNPYSKWFVRVFKLPKSRFLFKFTASGKLETAGLLSADFESQFTLELSLNVAFDYVWLTGKFLRTSLMCHWRAWIRLGQTSLRATRLRTWGRHCDWRRLTGLEQK